MSREERDRRAAFAQEATAHVDAVAAALRAAELDLEFTRVTSPIDGRVGRAHRHRGQSGVGRPGEATLLTTVVSVDPIYASFDADEQTLPALRRPRSAADAPARGNQRLPIRDGARPTNRTSRTGHAGVPRQPARSRDRHDPRPRDLPQPRRRSDAGPVRPAAPAGHRVLRRRCSSRIAPSAPTSTSASSSSSAATRRSSPAP